MTSHVDHLKNIFAWAGLCIMLRDCPKEDFTEDLEPLQNMLFDVCLAAKKYQGDHPQIKAGYTEILESIPTLLSFSPNLSEKLRETL